MESLIGNKEKIKIIGITNNEKYFVSKTLDKKQNIFIENTGDYSIEELIGKEDECVIINVIKNNLIGFLINDRKFYNDIKKIEEKIKNTNEYGKIKDIYLMERLKIKGKVFGLYLVDEGDIGKYYLDTLEIGTYIKKERENNIIFKNRKIEDEIGKQIRDVVQSIDLTKKEISLKDEEDKQRHLIEKAIELETEYKITKIATLDLKQELKYKKTIEQNKKILQNNINYKPEKEFNKKNDINVKQEMEMNDKITDMKTLGQLLEKNNKLPKIEGKKFVKMGVIESDHIDEIVNENKENVKANTTRYSFVAIASDGTVVPMNLTQDHQEGNNPREMNYQVTQKGEVKKDDVQSRFNIGEGTFAIKNGEYGEIKVYHSPRKTIGGKDQEGNMSLDRELETNNVWNIKKNERDLASEFKTGYRSVEKSYQEAKKHEDENGNILENDEVKIEDIDGDVNTKSHVHDDVNFDEIASKWGYYVDGKPNAERAKEIFEEKRKDNPDKETKEIIEMVSEEIEEELRNPRSR